MLHCTLISFARQGARPANCTCRPSRTPDPTARHYIHTITVDRPVHVLTSPMLAGGGASRVLGSHSPWATNQSRTKAAAACSACRLLTPRALNTSLHTTLRSWPSGSTAQHSMLEISTRNLVREYTGSRGWQRAEVLCCHFSLLACNQQGIDPAACCRYVVPVLMALGASDTAKPTLEGLCR